VRGARTELVDLEEMSDRDIEDLQDEFRRLHARLSRTGQLPDLEGQAPEPAPRPHESR